MGLKKIIKMALCNHDYPDFTYSTYRSFAFSICKKCGHCKTVKSKWVGRDDD